MLTPRVYALALNRQPLRIIAPIFLSLLLAVTERANAQLILEPNRIADPWHAIIPAQLLPFDSSLFYAPDRFDIEYSHQLTLYQWASTLQATHFADTGIRYRALLDARSRLREGTSLRTNEAAASLYISKVLASEIALFGTSVFTTYSSLGGQDNLLTSFGNLNEVANGYAIAGFEYNPDPALSSSLGAGYARESQNASRPDGYMLKGRAVLSPLDILEDQWLSGSAGIDERQYPDKHKIFRDDGIMLSLLSLLEDGTSNRLTTFFTSARRDLSLISGGAPLLQRRSENRLQLLEELSYPVVNHSLLSGIRLEFENRSVIRRTDGALPETLSLPILTAPENIATQRLLAELQLQTMRPILALSSELRLRYEERSENFNLLEGEVTQLSSLARVRLAETLDESSSIARQTLLSMLVARNLGEESRLTAQSTVRILRYDTPSANNLDDRDELLTNGLLRFEHEFSALLQNNSELRLGRSHTVYLRAERSAQNSVTQSLTLSNETFVRRAGSFHVLRAEVFANYTTLDYEDIVPLAASVSSYVVRGLQVRDSSDLLLGRWASSPLWLDLAGAWNIYEQGSYNASKFTEYRLTLNQEYTAFGSVRLVVPLGEIALGAKGFWLDRVSYASSLGGANRGGVHTIQSRVGPTGSLILRSGDGRFNVVGAVWIAEVTGSASSERNLVSESHLSVRIIF